MSKKSIKEKSRNSKKQLNSYIKFSGIAFQMIAIICVFSYLGIWLDEKFPNSYSIYTIIFSLVGVVSSMYMIIKQVISMNKEKK